MQDFFNKSHTRTVPSSLAEKSCYRAGNKRTSPKLLVQITSRSTFEEAIQTREQKVSFSSLACVDRVEIGWFKVRLLVRHSPIVVQCQGERQHSLRCLYVLETHVCKTLHPHPTRAHSCLHWLWPRGHQKNPTPYLQQERHEPALRLRTFRDRLAAYCFLVNFHNYSQGNPVFEQFNLNVKCSRIIDKSNFRYRSPEFAQIEDKIQTFFIELNILFARACRKTSLLR